MKAAKYIISTDHTANNNNLDAYIRLNATNDTAAMVEAYATINDMENLYCTTIYKLVSGTNGKEYRPLARNYNHGGFYVAGTGSWDVNHRLERGTYKNEEWFELRMDF